jgi:hypothetical protein
MIAILKGRFGLDTGLHGDVIRLIMALSVTSISSGYIGVVRPIYLNLFGFTPVQIGLLMTVDSISGALRATLFGVLADRYGRKPVLLLVYLTTLPFHVVYLLSTDYRLFVLAAIFAGTGAVGHGGVVQQVLITEKVGDTRRNAAFSLQNRRKRIAERTEIAHLPVPTVGAPSTVAGVDHPCSSWRRVPSGSLKKLCARFPVRRTVEVNVTPRPSSVAMASSMSST